MLLAVGAAGSVSRGYVHLAQVMPLLSQGAVRIGTVGEREEPQESLPMRPTVLPDIMP